MTTLKELSEGLEILSRHNQYNPNLNEVGADNGEIVFYVSQKNLPPTVRTGKNYKN